MLWLKLALLISSTSLCFALPASPASSAQASQSTACGDIVNGDTDTVNASLAYACLTSVPFNSAVALGFLDYYNDTLKFQSTLTYLKSPPQSYQQPGVDLLEGLATLKQGIEDGIFPNQYEFEAALQTLLYAAHDGHVLLSAGILSAFMFSSPQDVVSLSLDGIQPPQVYLVKDLADSDFATAYLPSPISTINGVDAVTYLTTFAGKNSIGMLEPHADWNQLMRSAAQDIQGYINTFGFATFYPGDTITFKLENGTTLFDYFLASYFDPGNTGPLQTGGDFYNYFVLGLLPASYNEDLIDNNNINETAIEDQAYSAAAVAATTSTSLSSSASAAPTTVTSSVPTCESWSNLAYPDCADVSEENLGLGGGYVSGYFLNSTNVAVLSIPSFDVQSEGADTFDAAILNFITKSQQAGMKKIVIDVQSNQGGYALLAIDTFKRFFPNINPFQGSRLRAHPAADSMGTAITSYFETFNSTDSTYGDLITNEWVAITKINADTNRLFTSWAEEFGPHSFDGDNFTTTQRYNLTNTLFDSQAVSDDYNNFTVFGYGSNSASYTAPAYAAEDIIILTDSICDSSCTLFVEMMHHEAGVRVVVAGGRPVPGPMQGASGSRGARIYTTDELDSNIEFAQEIIEYDDSSANPYFLPNRTTALSVYVTFASINLRDQVRPNETTPLQFAYEAADCRIFYTPSTFYNYSALWQYAADAIWTNPSLCVNGSTGFASQPGAKINVNGPSPSSDAGTITANDILGHLNTSDTSKIPYLTHDSDSINDAIPVSAVLPIPCNVTADCLNSKKANHQCAVIQLCDALGNPEGTPSKRCLKTCTNDQNGNSGCSGAQSCQLHLQICSKEGAPCTVKNPDSVHKLTNTSPKGSGVCDLTCKSGLTFQKKSVN